MALIAAHLNGGVIVVLTVQRQVYIYIAFFPHIHKPCGFCGRYVTMKEGKNPLVLAWPAL